MDPTGSFAQQSDGFIVPIEIRQVEGKGLGVFAASDIAKDTLVWRPHLVQMIPKDVIAETLRQKPYDEAHVLLRQSFVAPSNLDHLCVNQNDNGRFTNHSKSPNIRACEDASEGSFALRNISSGEEITCDYGTLASPEWYMILCNEFNVVPTNEVASKYT
mmetsp:Transcript_15587/g.22907  ORF Transcript_15587/g.22907 Transcript_15587/m.22907 type:complete len:160 (-) Transcript_15587:61-540(-)|eukprot:CAMPEP_0113946246 /NCGR_PEP_ID=MMETSP1339-20121228/55867_1 /TAXON_ID=94617 /ORGANISM="Fibrocapsa japonica" /LENGTH=159 /DNA_ID=CAMNT_0000952243 /DNA_START=63 /DNA_END=542 /DNA_ORIENTATION=- /assembly_acc=CAM_ASM_000762